VAVLLAGLLLVLWITQRRLIYLPLTQKVPPVESVLSGAEEVELRTEDGLGLHAWFVPGSKGAAVLIFNGNAGHRAHRAPLAEALSNEGFSVLLVDYRGYGGNPGRPSEAGLASDARAARAWLEARAEVDRIAYFGESLGAAVAVGLATEEPPEALILRSPFTSLADVGRVHYPYLPVRLLLWDRYQAIDGVGSLEVPTLVIAGERDGIVPVEQSKAVFEAAREPKRLVIIPDADHNDHELLAGGRLIEEVVAFLEEHVPDS
jgi:fermentation-respiration switch protein FrsA (DUF1100 family)